MLRKIVFVLVAALALPLAAATAAGADVQYPPTGGGSTVPARQERSATPARTSRPAPAPLARTGSDLVVLAGVAVVVLAGGAVVLMASRRRATAV